MNGSRKAQSGRRPARCTWYPVRGHILSGVLFEIDRERLRIRFRRGRCVEVLDLAQIIGLLQEPLDNSGEGVV